MTSSALSNGDSSRALFVAFSIFLISSSSASNISTTVTPNSNGSTTATGADVNTSTLPRDVQSSENSMGNGLRGLYTMSATFLDVVQPPGKNLFDELGVGTALNASSNQPLVAWEKAFNSRRPQFFLSYFAGFSVCLAFGAVFVVVVPVVGVFLCLCRCCCHACGHEDTGTPEKRRDRAMRICLGTALLIITIVILAGAICAFMSNELVRRQTMTSDDDVRSRDVSRRSLLDVVTRGFEEVDAFKQEAVQESKNLLEKTNHSIYQSLSRVNDFPSEATAVVKRLIRTDELRGNVSSLNNTLLNIIDSLKAVDENSESLKDQYKRLNDSLTRLQTDLMQLCHSNRGVCNVPNLTIGDGFDESHLFNVSVLISTLEPFVRSTVNVSSLLDDTIISNRIQKNMKSISDAVNRANVSGVISGLQTTVEVYGNNRVPSFNSWIKNINETKQNVEKYGDYRYYVCVAISSFLLLVVVLNLLGLCIGAFSKAPLDDSSSQCVTRWTAGYCLLVSVALMFAFSFVVMVIVALLFVSGGVVYTEGCRGFLEGDRNNAIVKTVDVLLETELQNKNVSLVGILRDCEQDVGIVKALNLDEAFNITGQLNTFKNWLNFDFKIDFVNSSFDLSSLIEAKSRLNELKNRSKEIPDIAKLQKNLNDSMEKTISNINEAVDSLNKTAENVSDERLKQELLNITRRLQNVSDTLGAQITETTNRLQVSLSKLNESLYLNGSSKPFAEFLQNLSELIDVTMNRINNDLPGLLQQLIQNTTSKIKSEIETIVSDANSQMMTSVGRCRPLSNVISDVHSSFCYSTLDPYNAFWFSYGWSVFFFIPSIAIAVSLATLYFRSDDIDLSCYDAYKTTDDYLRLQNLATPKHSADDGRHGNRTNGVAASNHGYVDDGDDSVSSSFQRNGDSGIDYYRYVGRPGDSSHSNRSYLDSDPGNFYIERPIVHTMDGNSNGNVSSPHHRF